jgi:hypothetical protein
MTFPSRPHIGPKDKVVAFRCRRKNPPCDSMQAVVREVRTGVKQFICVKCGNVTGINQGGSTNL